MSQDLFQAKLKKYSLKEKDELGKCIAHCKGKE
jgi:hypothetical protein